MSRPQWPFRALQLAAVVITLLALTRPSTVNACPPPPEDYVPLTVVERVRRSDIVVVGEVVSTTLVPSISARVRVSTTIKGEPVAQLDIDGFGGGHECKSSVRVGETWIFFTKIRDGRLMANHFNRYDAVEPVNDLSLTAARIGASGVESIFLPRLGLAR